MDVARPFARRSLALTILFFSLLYFLVAGTAFWVLNWTSERLMLFESAQVPATQLTEIMELTAVLQERFFTYFLPVSAAVFLVIALLLWLFTKAVLKSLLKRAEREAPAARPAKEEKPSAKAEAAAREKRLYLYLVAHLQREGRFLDFLAEDLELYEDAQIGAAVRNIHESCRKLIDKNLKPGAVIDRQEGEEVTIDPGFDPNSVKLTGNVSGNPPFKGILRHKGWKAQKVELPAFSGAWNDTIIAPAEVEVL